MLPDSCCTWEERFRLFLNFFVRFAVGEVGDLDTEDSSSSDDSSILIRTLCLAISHFHLCLDVILTSTAESSGFRRSSEIACVENPCKFSLGIQRSAMFARRRCLSVIGHCGSS